MTDHLEFKIGFGPGFQSVQIPARNFFKLALPPEGMPAAADPQAAIQQSLAQPIGTDRLSRIVKPGQKVVILMTDHTRPLPVKLLLPAVLTELEAGGIKLGDITIMAAPGTHPPCTEEELIGMVGAEIFAKVKCTSHDSEDMTNMVFMGTTQRGTPIELNKIAMEADVRITMNLLEPHHDAGWSGGSKNIMPGISSQRSVFKHHSLSRSPGVEIGRLDGNPFREDIDEIGRKGAVHFSIDVVMTDSGQLVKAFAGDLIKAHRAGVGFSRKFLVIDLAQAPDIVIAGVGGSPRDTTFWQVEGKIINRVRHVVRPGGILILVAACDHGFGDQRFGQRINSGTAKEIIENVTKLPYTVLNNKAFRFACAAEKAGIHFVTKGLTQKDFQTIPMGFFSSLQDATDAALKKIGSDASVLVAPNAAAIVLKVAK